MDDSSSPIISWKPRLFWEQRLLECPSFLGLEEEVRDVRPHGSRAPRIHPCPTRSALLDTLAELLEVHDCALSFNTWPEFATERERAITVLQVAAGMLRKLRQRGIPLEDSSLHHRSTRILLNRLHETADLLSRIQPADELHAGGLRPGPTHPLAHTQTNDLVWGMARLFRLYGPPTFSQEAIYRAMAAILGSLGILSARGKPFTTAWIKKLRMRDP